MLSRQADLQDLREHMIRKPAVGRSPQEGQQRCQRRRGKRLLPDRLEQRRVQGQRYAAEPL